MPHKPVLVQEVLAGLNPAAGDTVVDGTMGAGGHSAAILERIGAGGRLIGLDQDPEAVARCRDRFQDDLRVSVIHENFRHMGRALEQAGIRRVNRVLLDLGYSSNQMEEGERGFSFDREGPLDMRMDPRAEVTARDLVNDLSEEELAKMIFELGEERRSRIYARAICRRREKAPLETTRDLSDTILSTFSSHGKAERPGYLRRHPATRVFQALRIVVNDELRALKEGLQAGWQSLEAGGRMAVISFHSLEDRIVKHQFQEWARSGGGRLITKKPVEASREECQDNPRSRTAKLRTIEKAS